MISIFKQRLIICLYAFTLFSAGQLKGQIADTIPRMERNLVAILPFKYLSPDESMDHKMEMSVKIQEECYNILRKNKGMYKYQDPTTTNAILFKKGIDENSIKGYTPGELAAILGVEYVIQGSLSRYSKDQVTAEEHSSEHKDKKGTERQVKVANTTVSRSYKNQLAISIYNIENEQVFSHKRDAFLNTENAYIDAMNFILKRCPVWNKR